MENLHAQIFRPLNPDLYYHILSGIGLISV